MTNFNLTPDTDGTTFVVVTAIHGTADDFTVTGVLADDESGSTATRRFVGPDVRPMFYALGSWPDGFACDLPCRGWVGEVTIDGVESFGTCSTCSETIRVWNL